jgi:hypothetical protein
MKLAHTLLFEAGMLDEKKKNFKRLPKEATDWGALGFAPILVWDHLGILVFFSGLIPLDRSSMGLKMWQAPLSFKKAKSEPRERLFQRRSNKTSSIRQT